jgi:hypothetical protein
MGMNFLIDAPMRSGFETEVAAINFSTGLIAEGRGSEKGKPPRVFETPDANRQTETSTRTGISKEILKWI